jgi:hypothetical protein
MNGNAYAGSDPPKLKEIHIMAEIFVEQRGQQPARMFSPHPLQSKMILKRVVGSLKNFTHSYGQRFLLEM